MEQENKSSIFDFKKNKWIIIISLLVCLNMYTCTNSCTNQRSLKKNLKYQVSQVDSLQNVANDLKGKNDSLEKCLSILDTEKKGLERSINIQNEAINQITTAKKNIHVTIKEKK